jgi:hypothetical protein
VTAPVRLPLTGSLAALAAVATRAAQPFVPPVVNFAATAAGSAAYAVSKAWASNTSLP